MRNYIKFPGRKDPLNTQHIEWEKKKIRTKVHYHKISEYLKGDTYKFKNFQKKNQYVICKGVGIKIASFNILQLYSCSHWDGSTSQYWGKLREGHM